MRYRRWPRRRYCAVYVELPFEVHETAIRNGPVVIPAREGTSDAGRAPVRIRFHRAPARRPVLASAAPAIAWSSTAQRSSRAEPLQKGMQMLDLRVESISGHRYRVVELITRVPRGRTNKQVSTDLTEYCLRALNRFLGVYVVATEQSDAHEIQFENLGPETTIGLRRHVYGQNTLLVMPNLDAPLPGETAPDREGHLPLLPRLLAAELNHHPIDRVRQLKVRADRLAARGDFEIAIITLQSSAERLVFALHELLGVDEGATRTQINEQRPTSFKPALTGLSTHLGGNWSLKGNHHVAVYWRDLYLARNRVVHAGMPADRDTVADAFLAYEALWGHCLDRCTAVRAGFPRTALAVLGGIGLVERDALDNRMRTLIAQIEAAGEAARFWLPADER
jgi:hypothetical protein